jgi:hypothetical protein
MVCSSGAVGCRQAARFELGIWMPFRRRHAIKLEDSDIETNDLKRTIVRF